MQLWRVPSIKEDSSHFLASSGCVGFDLGKGKESNGEVDLRLAMVFPRVYFFFSHADLLDETT